MNSSWAVGDILAFTFLNLRDNTISTENRKYICSNSSGTGSSSSSSSSSLYL